MNDMLLHTLAWTGVLILVVLILRRPVSRTFGPEAAYALWVLPLFRLVLPPVTLPAWMAPKAAPSVSAAASLTAEPVAADAVPAAANLSLPEVAAAPAAGFDLLAVLAAIPWGELALAIWLAGAAVTLWLRFAAYFALRDDLLAEGREVGRAPGALGGLLGRIRLVETPATRAPLAMGVLDPVIALPPGFMALHDRAARDLALAHELAHHRGGDLLVNILVQPLFALHWWNPLARFGWLALRRDQEAACDARVMARRDAHERAAYAALIARFAAQPGAAHNAALTAPMACPVLGEKSIIHRLRSLTMSEPSPRRRLAGRALLGAGLLAIPLTASVSYAAIESAAVEAPEPPAPPAPPEPPVAPDAPTPPDAPEAPPAPEAPKVVIIERTLGEGEAKGEGTEVTERVWRDADGKERRMKIVLRRSGDAKGTAGMNADAIESAEWRAELRESLAEADKALADLPRITAEALAQAEIARATAPRVMMLKNCTASFKGESETVTGKDGRQTIMICQPRIAASARLGLEQARAEIAADKSIPDDTRKQVLRTLDNQIERWKDKEG
jgi:beta-lactamase regulating signal transducer with metallopeptidase domain